MSDSSRCHGVGDIMNTRDMEGHADCLLGKMEDKMLRGISLSGDVRGPEPWVIAQPFFTCCIKDLFLLILQGASPHPGIIQINNQGRAFAAPGKQLLLGPGNSFDGVQPFQMHGMNIDDTGNIRFSNIGKSGNFTRPVHTHLQDNNLVPCVHGEQREGQPDKIIEIPSGLQDPLRRAREVRLPGPPILLKDCRRHLLDRGFAAAAGNRHH